MIYLASPYSGSNKDAEDRYNLAIKAINVCFDYKVPVFSPIAHWHVAAGLHVDSPSSFDDFREQNFGLIKCAHQLWVLCLDDWKNSTGVRNEINLAAELLKEILYVDFNTLKPTCAQYARVHGTHKFFLSAKLPEKQRIEKESLSWDTQGKSLIGLSPNLDYNPGLSATPTSATPGP